MVDEVELLELSDVVVVVGTALSLSDVQEADARSTAHEVAARSRDLVMCSSFLR